MSTDTKPDIAIDRSVGDFSYDVKYEFDAGVGLSEKTIDYIAGVKDDPEWIRQFRQDAYKKFKEKPMPTNWASHDLDNIIFDNIRYYLSQGTQPKRSWDDVPEEMKLTFERSAFRSRSASSSPAWKRSSTVKRPIRISRPPWASRE